MSIIDRLLKETGFIIDKFNGIYYYTETDKIAITDNGILYIQPKSVLRYFYRKYNKQNSLRFYQYIKNEILENFIKHLNEILSLYPEKYFDEDYIILINANHNIIVNIIPALNMNKKYYSTIQNKEYLYKALDQAINQLEVFCRKFINLMLFLK